MCPTYQPNVPQPTDLLSISQNDLLENFQQLNIAFAIDHATYNDANQGKHNKVTFPVVTAPAGAANEFYLYNANGLFTGNPNLWLQTGAAPATAIPITGDESALKNANGWAYLPNGILLQWGTYPNITHTGAIQQITFPVAFNTAFAITGNLIGVKGNVGGNAVLMFNNLTATKVDVGLRTSETAFGTLNAYWFAIGI